LKVANETGQLLSAEQLFQHVLSRAPRVAAFDCDGTLWSVDAGRGFFVWEVQSGFLPRATSERMKERYELYRGGDVGEIEICGEMVACHAGLREDELVAACREFASTQIVPHIFPEMLQLARRLSEEGVQIWAVTSTWSWIVREALHAFGIDPQRVLGVEIAMRDGIATDQLLAVPSGPMKAAALENAGIRVDAAFGNSIHDLQMLEAARQPYAINPNRDLQSIAVERRWPIYQPEQ